MHAIWLASLMSADLNARGVAVEVGGEAPNARYAVRGADAHHVWEAFMIAVGMPVAPRESERLAMHALFVPPRTERDGPGAPVTPARRRFLFGRMVVPEQGTRSVDLHLVIDVPPVAGEPLDDRTVTSDPPLDAQSWIEQVDHDADFQAALRRRDALRCEFRSGVSYDLLVTSTRMEIASATAPTLPPPGRSREAAVHVALDDDERKAVVSWLGELLSLCDRGGPVPPFGPPAAALGLADLKALGRWRKAVSDDLGRGRGLAPSEWARVLVATRIAQVSDRHGSGFHYFMMSWYWNDDVLAPLIAAQRRIAASVLEHCDAETLRCLRAMPLLRETLRP